MENKLIEIYLLVCHLYDMQSELHWQPNRNAQPYLSVPELMTIYLFGQLNGHFKKRGIYDFTSHYWRAWFPSLGSYQAFCRRLNLLENHFQMLLGGLLTQLQQSAEEVRTLDHLIDSMPVILAQGSKSKRAKLARQIASTGFCATKQMHFHGVRLHLIAKRQPHQLPRPTHLWLERANTHDLTALRTKAAIAHHSNLFGDKAYASRPFKQLLHERRQVNLLTPIKKPKGGELSPNQKHYNKLVSKIRQPIESFFKWLIDKTDIQRASTVRSTDGLLVHCLGKLSFALLLLNFYY
ncbi:MAG: IS982 family transposase [Pyrinomonadaceae bacterium]